MLRLKLKHLKHYYIFCIDIYSASWGPDDDGRTVDGPGPLTRQALGNHHINRPNRPNRPGVPMTMAGRWMVQEPLLVRH